MALAGRDRLILAGADPPRHHTDRAPAEAGGGGGGGGGLAAMPAVLHGRWQTRGDSSGVRDRYLF